MEELTEDRICEMLTSALERIAFVFAEPLEMKVDCPADRHATISFDSSERSGRIYLSAENGFLAELAANLLGVEPEEVNEEENGQALTELANILGGEVILALGASSVVFKLGLPEEIDSVPEAGESSTETCVESEGGVLSVRLEPV